MCGIWTFIKLMKHDIDLTKLFQDFWNIKMRGPDNSYFENYKNVWVGFHRLAIMDTSFASNQPFVFQEKERTVVFICNGEIYNFRELIEKYDLPILTNSDCMTIPELYLKFTKENRLEEFYKLFESTIKGEFSFILFEFDRLKNLSLIIAGRDQIGIRPLYYHDINANSNNMIFCSEIKGTNSFEGEIKEFPPGSLIKFTFDNFGQYKKKDRINFETVYNNVPLVLSQNNYLAQVKDSVINSIKRRLDADRPLAFLLSGGVDSSLVAGISSKLLGYPIRTFCCGMNEGTDLIYARKVAKHIGSHHTEVFFTPEEGLEAIKDVIWTTETWDTTTIRASVGQYIVSKYIGNNTDAKVVLVGEGPDEICSSYLFNWYGPNDSSQAIHNTAVEYVKNIHYYDSRRGDRCISRWGLEGRVPLLDPEFINAYWNIPSNQRHPKYMNMEKWWLRKAFENTNIIPDEVLWRKKEAFSDGVSGKEKSWFEIIQEHVEDKVTDEELTNASIEFPHCPPKTKEAYYYRKVFCELFGKHRQTVLPNYWQPKWLADGTEVKDYVDPSARTLTIY